MDRLVLMVIGLVAIAAPASAVECDCSRRVGLCQAEAVYDGQRIAFTSQTDQCSRIAFSMNDHSAAITIQRGRGEAAFQSPDAAKGTRVSVESCYVCDIRGNMR